MKITEALQQALDTNKNLTIANKRLIIRKNLSKGLNSGYTEIGTGIDPYFLVDNIELTIDNLLSDDWIIVEKRR